MPTTGNSSWGVSGSFTGRGEGTALPISDCPQALWAAVARGKGWVWCPREVHDHLGLHCVVLV